MQYTASHGALGVRLPSDPNQSRSADSAVLPSRRRALLRPREHLPRGQSGRLQGRRSGTCRDDVLAVGALCADGVLHTQRTSHMANPRRRHRRSSRSTPPANPHTLPTSQTARSLNASTMRCCRAGRAPPARLSAARARAARPGRRRRVVLTSVGPAATLRKKHPSVALVPRHGSRRTAFRRGSADGPSCADSSAAPRRSSQSWMKYRAGPSEGAISRHWR